ncbi:hypothetical protein Taro_010114, partial [Colocasia esculenta]|nr:hypothetical protein [Colocasia esculenta]
MRAPRRPSLTIPVEALGRLSAELTAFPHDPYAHIAGDEAPVGVVSRCPDLLITSLAPFALLLEHSLEGRTQRREGLHAWRGDAIDRPSYFNDFSEVV